MEPAKKSPEIEAALEKFSGRSTAIIAGKCVNPPFGCGKPFTGFKDECSRREASISGLCQQCQDKIFGDDND